MFYAGDELLRQKTFGIEGPDAFNARALELFYDQYHGNSVYRQFCDGLRRTPANVARVEEIPFLPAEFFKSHRIASVEGKESMIFHSSGTGGSVLSTRLVFDPDLYRESILRGFSRFFGNPSRYRFCFLIPAPAERPDSSLAFMAKTLLEASGNSGGFFLDQEAALEEFVTRKASETLFLLGLSFALLDLADRGLQVPDSSLVLETGGMKGRRMELPREVLHERISRGLGMALVGSEYGMCELFSQAWSRDKGIFYAPPWMRVLVRDLTDPACTLSGPGRGGINVIDLANVDTCAFIATGDIGRVDESGAFEIYGRLNDAGPKGCALMLDET